MPDPIVFAETRLAEDKRVALATVIPKAAGDGITDDTAAIQRAPNARRLAWQASSEADEEGTAVHWVLALSDSSAVAHAMGVERGTGPDVARHVALHDPARALREVEAGQRILERHKFCGIPWGGGQCDEAGHVVPPCPDLADLLARWADHPDYDRDWNTAS